MRSGWAVSSSTSSPKEAIIFRVGYFRTVLTVVEMIVMSDFPAQRGNPLFDLAVRHGPITHE